MTTTKTAAADKAKSAPKDAIALLKTDHEAVSQLFAEYEKTRSKIVSPKLQEPEAMIHTHSGAKASTFQMIEPGLRT